MVIGGPASLGLIRLEHEIQIFAELGVSLLLFSLGLEFSWTRLAGLGGRALLSGVLQIVITAVAAAAVGVALRLPLVEAIAVGAMIALSSTACVLRVLAERGHLDSVHGRDAIAILLIQDMAVVPLAILMTVLAGGESITAVALNLSRTIGFAVALVAAMYVVLNIVAVRALGQLVLERNRELTVLLAVVTGLGAAWASQAAGLSPALGAFVAGLFLAGSPFATQIRSDVASFRVVLLTLFFGAAGMVANPVWMFRNAPLVLTVAGGIIVGKLLLVWLTLRLIRRPHAAGVATGVCLAQIGEFAFVLGSIGVASGVVSEGAYQTIVSATIATLFFTPLLVPAAPHVGAVVARWLKAPIPADDGRRAAADAHPPDVIIVGFGPAGQHVGHALRDRGPAVSVIDLNPRSLRTAAEFGFRTMVGDATQVDVLEHAHADRARLFVITLPDRHATSTVLAHVRRLVPTSIRIARCRYDLHEPEISAAGATAVVRDEQEVGRQLAAEALLQLVDAAEHDAPPDDRETTPEVDSERPAPAG
jgi:CPA2 family monovalent cation:H+ antiporter-2